MRHGPEKSGGGAGGEAPLAAPASAGEGPVGGLVATVRVAYPLRLSTPDVKGEMETVVK